MVKSKTPEKSKMKGQKGELDLAQGHCEGKQIGSKSKVAKKLDFERIENDGNRKLKRKSKELNTKMEGKRAKLRKEETSKVDKEKVSTRFIEDGDEVLIEVEGQTTEFSADYPEDNLGQIHENSTEEDSESEEEECEEGEICSNNNNVVGNQSRIEYGKNSGDTRLGESSGMEQNLEKHSEEEDGMKRFVEYIKRQGLVIVEASQLNQDLENKQNKQIRGELW